jgi:DNA-binding NtrC family response regulator
VVPSGDSLQTLLRSAVRDAPDGTFVLTVSGGSDAGATIEVDGAAPGRMLIGKSEVCALRLSDPEASRRHASIELVGSTLRVTDLESTNGTWVDHVRVNDAILRGGETLRVGSTSISVARRDAGVNPAVPPGHGFGRVIGESRAMRRLYPLCEKLAQARVPVLIEGETGTGKEILAEALHEEGPLASAPFVVFDCTTVPPNLVESELFGHEKGAFTGATRERRGVFEQADGGTLFLDEIGDLDLALQAKLLRAVDRGEVRRVGGDRPLHVQARLLCATRRDLDREVQAGRFRDDLFHRLAVGRIELPPLRQRAGDVELLARYFWHLAGGPGEPPPQLIARWSASEWPGNVRELKNQVMRTVALGDVPLDPEDAPPSSLSFSSPRLQAQDVLDSIVARGLPLAEARQLAVQEFERRYLERILADHGGNVSRAAAASGIARRHLQRLRAKSR